MTYIRAWKGDVMEVPGKNGGVVTWQEAEDAMLAAVEYLGALPDRERGWMRGGNGWPEIVRDVRAGDYGDGQGLGEVAPPRRQLGRKEMAVVRRMVDSEDAAGNAVPERCGSKSCRGCSAHHQALKDRRAGLITEEEMANLDVTCEMPPRRLVGRVLIAKLDPRGDVFGWERIWLAEGGKRCGVTSDALRMRYERAIGKVAAAMGRTA